MASSVPGSAPTPDASAAQVVALAVLLSAADRQASSWLISDRHGSSWWARLSRPQGAAVGRPLPRARRPRRRPTPRSTPSAERPRTMWTQHP